jgi:uncharacterized protein (TIGR00290 family)
MEKEKAVFNWSGGKDSALCLHKVLAMNSYTVSCLLTTVNKLHRRISMHGVREELLEQQTANIGIPLVKMSMPAMPDMKTYETAMKGTLLNLKKDGNVRCVFGDIFLEDLRAYREQRLAEIGLLASFPLWRIPTTQLVREFIDQGFKAVIVCVNEKFLSKEFAGRPIDDSFLSDLPDTVDPCGEYGEFHSFVYDGPIFRKPVQFSIGEVVYRKYTPVDQDMDDRNNCYRDTPDPFDNGFWYCDLMPSEKTKSNE